MTNTPHDWVRVIFASDCTKCDCCGEHYADCECPGPNSEGWEFEERDGVLFARRTEE